MPNLPAIQCIKEIVASTFEPLITGKIEAVLPCHDPFNAFYSRVNVSSKLAFAVTFIMLETKCILNASRIFFFSPQTIAIFIFIQRRHTLIEVTHTFAMGTLQSWAIQIQ